VSVTYPLVFGTDGTGSGSGGTSLVLTRLHARYGKDSMGEDLVFRAADPIVGGREMTGPNGKLEQGASPAGANNFQARYAIRHAWSGPIACDKPRRGVWGGPPQTNDAAAPAASSSGATAARGLALAKRDGIQLASFFKLDPWTGLAWGATPPAPSSSSSSSSSSTPASSASAAPAPKSKGCLGCSESASSSGAGALAAVLASVLAIVARRRR
jgi:uncharacterized protein (TIGR03382 family)